ncbi:Acid sphingomyelinase-like phosphodiesterase 3b [Portunus trituberculatus]|uniref:Acid sphingomyelinase-like phosphodiesterase 3b n=1 Tax=Portunus trituberculatus TaxID=210409 RepID=A0A5B7EA76_PORTR|nr:Acid sphingomyelinase-like phosphodiesterase 3b [Portunus trituberculatus]
MLLVARTVAVVVVVVLAGHPHTVEAKIGTFWHVTDFHYDLNYTTSGDPKRMCWDTRFSSGSVGEFGDYDCDAPFPLLTSAVDAMKKFDGEPDFILWTGDDTAHVSNDYFSTEVVVNIVTNLTNLIASRFPNTPVFPVLGNHDYYPKNQMPVGPNRLQSEVADLWRKWFQQLQGHGDVYNSFHSSGRYAADVPGSNVTMVALNTLIWYKSNNETALLPDTTSDGLDPDGQFTWADSLLKDLAKKNRRVYLVGHIPPGTFERYQQKRKGFHWYQPRYNDRFTQLVQQHAHVIEAQFFAHHHTDSFRLFFEEEKNQEQRIPVSYQLLSPGVTPWRSTLSEETGANNPGIRLVHYNTTTGKSRKLRLASHFHDTPLSLVNQNHAIRTSLHVPQVVDVSTYYLNLSAANLEGRAEWHLEYNFSSTYNLKSVSPVALYEVAKTMKANRTLFDLYYRANTVGLEDPEKCTEKCRLLHWCAITEINYSRFYDCNNGVRLSWRAALGVVASVLVLVVR